VALAVVNPLLLIVPLVDPGPGKDSDCRRLMQDARTLPRTENNKKGPRSSS
jgi:AsmA protein